MADREKAALSIGHLVKFHIARLDEEKPAGSVNEHADGSIDGDFLGIYNGKFPGGHLFLKRSRLLFLVFGYYGELLDYIASHVNAGKFCRMDGRKYFKKSIRELSEYFVVSSVAMENWINFLKGHGVLMTISEDREPGTYYFSINQKVLHKVIQDHLDKENNKGVN